MDPTHIEAILKALDKQIENHKVDLASTDAILAAKAKKEIKTLQAARDWFTLRHKEN